MTQPLHPFNFVHCDVFATRPYSGNSLAVFVDSTGLDGNQMLTITQELRHFEAIFLQEVQGSIRARVFDLHEELPFAGHPIIGAACALHKINNCKGTQEWAFELNGGRKVSVSTGHSSHHYFGTLDQGRPEMIAEISGDMKPWIATAFNLDVANIANLPLEVISTGLKYLVVPVIGGLNNAQITVPDLEEKLASIGADFAYLFDTCTFEGRHWNNDGIMEDVATGSAAGVIGAYAMKHKLVEAGQTFTIRQGHFLGRPSEIQVTAFGTPSDISRVTVAGEVAFVGTGEVVAP